MTKKTSSNNGVVVNEASLLHRVSLSSVLFAYLRKDKENEKRKRETQLCNINSLLWQGMLNNFRTGEEET